MPEHPLAVLSDPFTNLMDPRVNRTKAHLLISVIAIAIGAGICGADSGGAIEEAGVAKCDTASHRWELPA